MTLKRINYTYRGKPSHRYELDGDRVPGVTRILNQGIPKAAIAPWAARSVAEYATDNLDQITDMLQRGGRGPTVDYLKGVPWQKRDEAAMSGTDVHTLAEAVVHGLEVDVPDHLYGYVDGYAHWLDQTGAEPILVEFTVASRLFRYAGTGDLILRVPGVDELVICDLKTSSGVYGETALQLAAYRFAEFYMDPDGFGEKPLPEVGDTGWVLHVQDGLTEARPVPVDAAQFRVFCAAATVADWGRGSRDLVGPPIRLGAEQMDGELADEQ